MKTRYVIALFAIVISSTCLAQNKTLGVGVATPNSNAALHVESPTNNQGFIMPRLTTAQRTAMAGLPLTTADDGLMVYDKDIKKIYVWDGAAWQLAAGLNLPFASSTASASPALDITNTGTSNAGLFRISNPANVNPALSSITDGTGLALALNVTNASNSGAALSIVHNGTGNAISANRPIQATQFVGDGSLLTNLPAVSLTLPFSASTGAVSNAFQITHTGTGNSAGEFHIQNTSSSASALRAQSDGSGAAFTATNIGTNGFAANFDNTDATNASPTVFVVNQGTAPAAVFNQTNALNSAPVLSISSSGSGPSIAASGSIEALQFVGDGSLLTGLAAGSGWGLSGNTGTDPATEFFGTTDAQDLVIKTNSAEAIRVMASGQVGIGSTPVSAKVDIANSTTEIGLHSAVSTASGVQNRALQGYSTGSTTQNIGVYGTGDIAGAAGAIGVYGEAIGTGSGAAVGVYASTNTFTATTGTSYGLFAEAMNGTDNWAGFFASGNLHVTNGISVGSPGNFGAGTDVLTSQGAGVAPIWAPVTVPDISITAANEDVSIGKSAGTSFQGVSIGDLVGGGGNGNVFIGKSVGSANTGNNNVFAGWQAGMSNFDGSANIFIGPGAGGGISSGVTQTTGNNNILIGLHTDVGTDGLNNAVAIGSGAVVNASNAIVLGDANATVGIGITNPTAKLEVINASTSGHGADIRINEVTSTNFALNVYNEGLGYSAYFRNGNGSATGNAILAENYGLSQTVRSFAYGSGDAGLFSVIGSGTGKGGVFSIANASNASVALEATTNGTGPAFLANQSNNGIAIDITAGTLKHSTFSTAGLTITVRAGVYILTGAGTYSLPTTGVLEGEVCLVYNSTGGSITVESQLIAASNVYQFVRIGGAWRVVQ